MHDLPNRFLLYWNSQDPAMAYPNPLPWSKLQDLELRKEKCHSWQLNYSNWDSILLHSVELTNRSTNTRQKISWLITLCKLFRAHFSLACLFKHIETSNTIIFTMQSACLFKHLETLSTIIFTTQSAGLSKQTRRSFRQLDGVHSITNCQRLTRRPNHQTRKTNKLEKKK